MNTTYSAILAALVAGLALASSAPAAQEGFPLIGVEEQRAPTEVPVILNARVQDCVIALRQAGTVTSAFDAFTTPSFDQAAYHAVGTPSDRFLMRKCIAERGIATTTTGSAN